MSDRSFFDTTILVYAVSAGDPRAAVAEKLLAAGGYISVQVLNEFATVARQTLKMSWEEIGEALAAVGTLCEHPVRRPSRFTKLAWRLQHNMATTSTTR